MLESMEFQVDSLMKDAISLRGKSENLCGLMRNESGYLSPEPPYQEAFEGLVMNFILDQEKKRPQLANLFRINEPVYRELVLEFFTTFEFRATTCRNSPRRTGIEFRLGGEHRSLSLVEFGWRVGLYFEAQAGELG
ncbi:hypothetical protein Tco_1154673 [Tanacetum coccineum]